jgi:hypothetical protein
LSKEFSTLEYYDKLSNAFNAFDRLDLEKNKILFQPFFKNYFLTVDYPNYVHFEDNITTPHLLINKNFYVLPTTTAFNEIDDNFETYKNNNYAINFANKFFLNDNQQKLSTLSHFFVLDSFRSNFDEFSIFIDSQLEKFPANLNLAFNQATNFNFEELNNDNFNSSNSLRFSNNINLRSTAKNSIVTYNAIQKIFKARFDEMRSHTKLTDFNSFYNKQPLISSTRTPYEKILKKNNEVFFKVNFYKNSFKSIFNDLYAISSSLNFYFFDFPFLLAFKSDSSRYL